VNAINFGDGASSLDDAEKLFAKYGFLLDYPQWLARINFADDFEKVKSQGRYGIIFGLQSSAQFETVDAVNTCYGYGQRISQLSYNFRSLVADGAFEPHDGGDPFFTALNCWLYRESQLFLPCSSLRTRGLSGNQKRGGRLRWGAQPSSNATKTLATQYQTELLGCSEYGWVMLKLLHDCNVRERFESGWFASQFRFAYESPQHAGLRKVAPHCGYPKAVFRTRDRRPRLVTISASVYERLRFTWTKNRDLG
jgi:hypothetical protein